MRMALLAEPLSAREALDCGLITHVAPDAEFPDLVAKLARRLAAGPAARPERHQEGDQRRHAPHLEAALDREHSGQTRALRTSDFAEGLARLRRGAGRSSAGSDRAAQVTVIGCTAGDQPPVDRGEVAPGRWLPLAVTQSMSSWRISFCRL